MALLDYDRGELLTILDSDFILNPDAFTAGRRNDDCVDAMCICHALGDKHFYEDVWLPHAKECNLDEDYYRSFVLPHVERIDDWLAKKSAAGYSRGSDKIMTFAINY